MNHDFLLKMYQRFDILPQIGKQGRKKISQATMSIVGMGALGSHCAQQLARIGIGKLILIDRDVVEEHNLTRQILYTKQDVGEAKAIIAKKHLEKINPDVQIDAHVADLDIHSLSLLRGIIVDGTDNMYTRFLLNDYAKKKGMALVFGAVVGHAGRAASISPQGPCLRCFLTEPKNVESCETAGVFPAAVAIVASIQVQLVLKAILGESNDTKLHTIDAWNLSMQEYILEKNPKCPACNGSYEYLEGKHTHTILKFCGSGSYQFSAKKNAKEVYAKKWKNVGEVKELSFGLKFGPLLYFEDGRVVIKAKDEKEAKSFYAKYVGA